MRDIHASSYKDPYFAWLVSLVGEEWYGHRYLNLLWSLYRKEYFWVLRNDENRAADGRALRIRFFESFPEYMFTDELSGEMCANVLEVWIALAERCSDTVSYPGEEDVFTSVFWFIIDNMGLSGMDDSCFTEQKEAELTDILFDWMSGLPGSLSPFWYNHHSRYFDSQELWYQMHEFVGNSNNFV